MIARLRTVRNRELVNLVPVALLTVCGFAAVFIARDQAISDTSLSYAAPFLLLYLVAHAVLRLMLPAADPYLLPIAALLTAIGEVEIYRMFPTLARDQALWIAIGVVVFAVVIVIASDQRRLERYRYTIGIAALACFAAPLLPGIGSEVLGARLWIQLGPLRFQPGEVGKVLLAVFLAAYLTDRREVLERPVRKVLRIGIPASRHVVPLIIPWAGSLALLVVLNDLGTSLLIYGLFLAMIYVATGRPFYVFSGLAAFAAGAAVASRIAPQVGGRVDAWLDPFKDELATGNYQIVQSLYTIADGGLFGTGLGRGFVMAGKDTVIPFAETDFIFSVIASETGLAGAAGLILLYVCFLYRGFRIAISARDGFAKLLAFGLMFSLAFQAFVIIGGVTRLIPITGLTLPFVSYGGSSVVANFGLLALLLSVSDPHTRRRPPPLEAGGTLP